jgi:hypothetical protein
MSIDNGEGYLFLEQYKWGEWHLLEAKNFFF